MSEGQKVALVTGASRGIGAATALALGKNGFSVVGTATSEKGAQAITERFQSEGIHGQGMQLDVNDSDSIKTVIDSTQEAFGAPAVLVNNAGITKDNLFLRMKEDEWQSVIDTNLTSLYRVSKAAIKAMTRARYGRIINISSVVGSMGNAGQVNYCSAKAGVEGFTRALAREVGSRNITVNAVAPGFIATDMTHDLPESVKETLMTQVPLGRLGQADEIAHAVAFLASEAAAYITGETLHVNGGMYMG